VPASLQKYSLCRLCADRQEAYEFTIVPESGCSLCEGLMAKATAMGELALKSLSSYEYKTFAVGVTLPEGVQEREDELRSVLRLKGKETIKTQAARRLAAFVYGSTKKKMDKKNPDVTILANFGTGEVSVTSKPIFYYGRYTKPGGLAQRRSYCRDCRGLGCPKCHGTGYEQELSVEDVLLRKLSGFSGSSRMVFTWLGSEDKESRVHQPGRPFVVEIKNPKKRKLPRRFGARFQKGRLAVTRGRVLPSKPIRFPSFRFKSAIRAVAESRITPDAVKKLRSAFKRTPVVFLRPNSKPTTKMVYSVTATARGRVLFIRAELDGGLPVKRFVSGELVSPSVSEVLKAEVSCRSFDILEVREIGGFEFAEITRSAEKD
jgi:tRNA pseudouridine synthase 10